MFIRSDILRPFEKEKSSGADNGAQHLFPQTLAVDQQ
jgi:hypothetical protein